MEISADPPSSAEGLDSHQLSCVLLELDMYF